MGFSDAQVQVMYDVLLEEIRTLRSDLSSLRARLDTDLGPGATQSALFPEQPGIVPCAKPALVKKQLSSEIDIYRGEFTSAGAETKLPVPCEIQKDGEAEKPTPLDVMELWNRVASPRLPRCRNMKGKRGVMAREKLKDYSLTDMEQAISAMNLSPFHLGQNQGKWVANIDYFLRGTIIQQFLEKWEAPAPATPYFKPGSLYGGKS